MRVPAFKDIKTGKPSYTLTAFCAGFLIINIKLLISGMSLTETIKFDVFTGTDYAAALAALGGIRIFNKKVVLDHEQSKGKEE